jgi:glycosyltransferase involved in cell wall biosynthesis
MKIALMSSQKDWGGGEQYLWSLGCGLIERGHKVIWVAPPASKLSDRISQHGFDQFNLVGRKPSPVAMLNLRRVFRKRNIQMLHANDSHAVLWGSIAALARSSIQRVGMKHTVFPIRSSVKYNWFLDKLVCVSKAVKELCLESGIAPQKLEVIYGGMMPPEYDRLQERSIVCKKLNIDPGIPLLSAVGSLIQCKGFDTLVEAARHLRLKIPEFCIAVCGEGALRGELEHRIRQHGLERHVRLIGFQDDPTAWIAASDVFVHPTRSEGLSLVTIAAQMVSTPVVATEVGGLREVMRCTETSRPLGWVFGSENPIELAELLEQSLSQVAKRRMYAREAYKSATARFHLNRMVDRFEDCYGGLLGLKRPRRSQQDRRSAA